MSDYVRLGYQGPDHDTIFVRRDAIAVIALPSEDIAAVTIYVDGRPLLIRENPEELQKLLGIDALSPPKPKQEEHQ